MNSESESESNQIIVPIINVYEMPLYKIYKAN